MKYLYKILRLFFCPHKYVEHTRWKIHLSNAQGEPRGDGLCIEKECKYCGSTKFFKNNC